MPRTRLAPRAASVPPLVTGDDSLPCRTIAGVPLHFRWLEAGAHPKTIIVLHGGPGGDFRSLQGLDALADRFNIVYYDQRGAGRSARVPDAQLTLDGHLEELRAVAALVSLDAPPILIGHSWGAVLAAAYLGRYPDAVDSAVLIEPGFLTADSYTRWRARSRAYRRGASYLIKAVMNGAAAARVPAIDDQARDDFLIGAMVAVFANHPKNPYHCGKGYTAPNWRFGAAASRLLDRLDAAELDRIGADASTFAGPVLLLAGACNTWIGANLQKSHVPLFSNASLQIVPEAGHDVVWDNPAATLALIRDFLVH